MLAKVRLEISRQTGQSEPTDYASLCLMEQTSKSAPFCVVVFVVFVATTFACRSDFSVFSVVVVVAGFASTCVWLEVNFPIAASATSPQSISSSARLHQLASVLPLLFSFSFSVSFCSSRRRCFFFASECAVALWKF